MQYPRPRILVLLGSHNGSRWIGEQLRSILGQRDADVHVVIRDDGSTDETRSRLEDFLHDGRVSLTRADSASGAAAQNFFALMRENSSAGFDFVALSDQDDEWHADKLARASRHLRATGSAGYSSATRAVWPNGRSTLLTQSARTSASDFLFEGAGQGCTFVLMAEFYDRVRSFLTCNSALTRSIHYHDWTLYALARAWNLSWTFDPVPSVRYRQHGRNDTGAKTSLGGIWKRVWLIRSGWYANQLGIIAGLCAAASPANPLVSTWQSIFSAPRTWSRRIRIAKFCLRGGRRGAADTCMILIAAAAGWI